MRAFIAIPLPDVCLKSLEETQQQLRKTGADVRWVSISSIHLTLKFLGETPEELIPKLAESIEDAAKETSPFELRLQELGCFPNQRNPRVVWRGLGGETTVLVELQKKVESACSACGFALEEREFRPHLTLGRVNGKRNLQQLLDCIKIGAGSEQRFTADHLNIYKSVLRPQGAVYTVLRTIDLKRS
jgi:RNA 2',3'-cyclic 3'-phosphodiesterase